MKTSVNKPFERTAGLVDAGLRAYMQKVFGMMALGLGVTGFVAYLVATTPALAIPILTTPLMWVFLIATFMIPVTIGVGINRLSASAAQSLFWVYAVLMGITTSGILLTYTGHSVARVFLITACMFGSMSLYGYVTKRDLSSWGSFLFMGLMGLVIASVVNLFVGSSAFQMALSVIGVLVFTGLTAYDVQMIRGFYRSNMDAESQNKVVTLGALSLYLDFVNIFFSLLRLMGDRR